MKVGPIDVEFIERKHIGYPPCKDSSTLKRIHTRTRNININIKWNIQKV